MVKGLRLAFVKQWGVFGRGCWVQELLLKLGIYTGQRKPNKQRDTKKTKRTCLKQTEGKSNKEKVQNRGGPRGARRASPEPGVTKRRG